jgi:hypothetical protein
LPIYCQAETQIVEEEPKPLQGFMGAEAQVMKVGQEVEWEEPKKQKKKVVITMKISEPRPDTWQQQWGNAIIPKSGDVSLATSLATSLDSQIKKAEPIT